MSTSRPPLLRDFASLKYVWETEGTGTPGEPYERTVSNRQSSPVESVSSAVQQPGAGNPESPPAGPGSQLQRQLEHAQLRIANLAKRQSSLEEYISRLQDDLSSKDAQVNLLAKDLDEAREQIRCHAAPDLVIASFSERETVLAEERAALVSDRALFERELDELDGLRRREKEVAIRESSLNQLQAEIDHRRVEVGELEALRSELNDKLQAAEAVRAAHAKAESDLRSAQRAIDKTSEERETLATEVKRLKGKLKKLREGQLILKNGYADVQGQLAIALETLDQRAKQLQSGRLRVERLRVERDQAKALLAAIPVLGLISEALLRWLAEDGSPECIGIDEDSRLGWSGVGSYDSDAFDRLLIELGIDQYDLPHPAITHVVVGRVGWSKEDLLAQIAMRQGQTLRVYSQEMLLAALMTGRDPLDCEDAEVLDSFRKGHPALEFLADSELEWPAFWASDTSEIDEVGGESLGVTESPLRALGYRVGETSFLSPEERQEILQAAFEMQHLPWVESDEYMAKWGSAGSHQRLWRIAFHLSMLLNGPVGRDWRKPQTRQDWLEDLEWLHEQFYAVKRFRFVWPHVEVT